MVSLVAVIAVHAQNNVTQEPPLFREDLTNSRINGRAPNALLTDGTQKFLNGDGNVAFNLQYICTRASGAPGSTDSGTLNDPCRLGAEQSATERRVSVFYNLSGGPPTTGDSVFTLATTSATDVLSSPYNLKFSGSNDFGGDHEDGGIVNFFVRVRVDPSAQNPELCAAGTTQFAAHDCFDPADTTGQPFYALVWDTSTPTFFVNDPANANAFNLTPTEWFIYSKREMSNFLPDITLTVLDNPLAAPIDQTNTKLYRNNTDNTTRFTKVVVSPHAIAYTFDYTQAHANSFRDDTATRIDVDTRDTVDHRIDTRTRTDPPRPALWVVMDNDLPVLDHENSQLKKRSGNGTFASLGERLGVSVNVTDMGGGRETPRQFLKVEARLVTSDNATTSPWYPVAFNTTSNVHKSENITVPQTWISGPTFAEVRVTDGALNTVMHNITGTVTVDVDRPTVLPLSPLDGTKAFDFVGSATVTFRARAADPNDSDEWNGANTQDTDNIGIQQDGVIAHFKVGEEGALQQIRLSPQTAVNTYAATRTFNPEDEVFFFFSAKDLAGNTVFWPKAGDPHVAVVDDAANANAGRYLKLNIDQVGPVVTAGRDLAFVGGGPHEFLFTIEDAGIGLDTDTPRFFYRIEGEATYKEATLAEATVDLENATGVVQPTDVFRTTIPTQAEGTVVQWYVTAKDTLGNTGTLGTANSPRSSTVDVTPPEVTVTAPTTTDTARFNVTWSGTDAGSGVKDYTLQFRVGATGQWFTVPTRERTALTQYEVCAATDRTYDFRVSVRDNALNERTFPAVPHASTRVAAAVSCAAPPEVTISSPTTGSTVSGTHTVRWNAVSTTFPGEIRVRIEVGQAGSFQQILTDTENTGTAEWDTTAAAQADRCLTDGAYTLRVVASDPNGLEGTASTGPFTLSNGITDCADRDNDNLPDAWEFLHFGNLNAVADDDPDGDGFTNEQEAVAGTNPTDARSRPGGGGAGAGGAEEWDNRYLAVVAAFVAVLSTFVVGMVRRW